MVKIKIINGVTYLLDPDEQDFPAKVYLEMRRKEGRLYTNEELLILPDLSTGHPLKKEWNIRKKTAKRLVGYFSKSANKRILEVGCGNGWLSNIIGTKTNNKITALDLNEFELLQGAKVFSDNPNLNFVYGNIFENIFTQSYFDFIILLGSVQYFRDFDKLILQLFCHLKKAGEIHILDSNFYSASEIESAQMRTSNYYKSLNAPEMIQYYYHRNWNELNKYNYSVMNSFKVRVTRYIKRTTGIGRNVFPWIIIRSNSCR